MRTPEAGAAIKRRRAEVVGSQEKMAATMGVSQSFVSQIERGIQDPRTLANIRFNALLDALRWSTAEFVKATGLELGTSGPDPFVEYSYEPTFPLWDGSPEYGGRIVGELSRDEMLGDDYDLIGLRVTPDMFMPEALRLTIPTGAAIVIARGQDVLPDDIVVRMGSLTAPEDNGKASGIALIDTSNPLEQLVDGRPPPRNLRRPPATFTVVYGVVVEVRWQPRRLTGRF